MPKDLTVAEMRKTIMESTHLAYDLKTELDAAVQKLEIAEKKLVDIKFEIDCARSSSHPWGVLGDIEDILKREPTDD